MTDPGLAERDRSRIGHPSGQWLWTIVLSGAVALITHATLGLIAAMAGWYSTWLVLPFTLLAGIGSIPFVRRAAPSTRTTASTNAVMVLVALGTLVYSAENIGEHVITRRDPGSYLTAGRWLADHGELHIDVGDPAFTGVDDVRFTGPAVYAAGASAVEFQFSHGAQTAMAAAFDLGGPRALFASSAVVGAMALLAVYLALTTMTRRPWLAVAGATALGVSLPFVFATRNTYSEPFVLLVVTLGLGVLLGAGRRPRADQLFLVGLLIGGAELFRIDARLYVVGLALLTSFLVLRGSRVRTASMAILGAVGPVVVATTDVRLFAGGYTEHLGSEVRALDVLTGASIAGFLIAGFVSRHWTPGLMRRPGDARLAVLAGLGVALAGAAAWLVRPHVLVGRASWEQDSNYADAVVRMQTNAGLDVDPSRSYSELGMESIGWYLGPPIVAFAIVGFSLVAWRLVRDPRSRMGPPAVLMAVGVPYYLWDNSITPDQLWATRRFLPMILPAFLLAAVWAADRVADAAPAGIRRRVLIVVVCTAMVLPSIATTWPVRRLNDQRGNHELVQSLCDRIGEDAVMVDLSDGLYAMTARAWCGASVATADHTGMRGIDSFLASAAEHCRPAYLISQTDGRLEPYRDRLDEVVLGVAQNHHQIVATLDKAPNEYRSAQTVYRLGVREAPDSCT